MRKTNNVIVMVLILLSVSFAKTGFEWGGAKIYLEFRF